MAFLPKDYKRPSDSRYLKLETGATRIRILSKAIVGTQWWTGENLDEVHRIPGKKEDVPREELNEKEAETIKHFWAMVVWNYEEEMVQVAVITQATIQDPIEAYAKNEKWGDPFDYDLVITRTGETKNSTKYTVQANPKEELDEHIKSEYEMLDIDLEALYRGDDVFGGEGSYEDDEITMEDVENAS